MVCMQSSCRETLHSSVQQAAPMEKQYSACWESCWESSFTSHWGRQQHTVFIKWRMYPPTVILTFAENVSCKERVWTACKRMCYFQRHDSLVSHVHSWPWLFRFSSWGALAHYRDSPSPAPLPATLSIQQQMMLVGIAHVYTVPDQIPLYYWFVFICVYICIIGW